MHQQKRFRFTRVVAHASCLGLLASFGLVSASEVICRVELEHGVLPAGKAQKAVVKIALDAPKRETNRPPVNLAIVLDRSGSMSGSKIKRAKEAAIAALRRLGRDDVFSLVIYDHRVETLVPAQSAANTRWIEERIRSIKTSGNTALFGGVSQGASEVRKHVDDPRFVHRIILLSDGLANVGPASPAELGRLGTALIKENIAVTTIGVGTDYNEDLLTQLSQRSDGNHYFVEASEDLPRIFATELGDVLSIVARKVVLEIEFPEGIRPVRIIGRDGRIEDDTVGIRLNQLYGGQQKFALVEVEVPAAEHGATRELAAARCTYEDPVTQSTATASGRASVRFSNDEQEIVRNVDKAVQADINGIIIATVKEQAIQLVDQGQKEQAVQLLNTNVEQMQQLGKTFGNDVVTTQSGVLQREALELQKKGMDKRTRKQFRFDNYNTMNQIGNDMSVNPATSAQGAKDVTVDKK